MFFNYIVNFTSSPSLYINTLLYCESLETNEYFTVLYDYINQ
jgi:hypothetical protein